MTGADEDDIVDPNQVGGRLLALGALDDSVAAETPSRRQGSGAEHRFGVEQPAGRLEVKDLGGGRDFPQLNPDIG